MLHLQKLKKTRMPPLAQTKMLRNKDLRQQRDLKQKLSKEKHTIQN